MTQEIPKEDRVTEILNFFINNGFEALKLLSLEAKEKFDVTPAEFYGVMISLLESFIKNFTTMNNTTEFKEIFNDEGRQKLVNFFDEVFSKAKLQIFLNNKN